MTDLSSMLVPLETLPGWPPVADPSPLQTLGLLVGLPLIVIVAAFAVAKIGNTVKASRGTTNSDTDPVWVGGPTRPEISGPEHSAAVEQANGMAELPGTDIENDSGVVGGRDVGGAGARW